MFWLLAGGSLVGVIAILDAVTGREVGFSLFYLIPVMIVTWFAGRNTGLVISLAAAIGWFGAEALAGQTYSQPLIGYWNAVIRLGFFVVVAMLLPALRELEQEKERSRVDPLTATGNRRHFLEATQAELEKSQQTRRPFSIAYIDIEQMKAINEQYGRHIGDKVLRTVGARIRAHLRGADLIARFRDDEFAILFPDTDQEAAKFIVTGIHSAMLGEMREKNWPVLFSIGAFTYMNGQIDVNDLMAQADQAMLSAKRSGDTSIQYSVFTGADLPTGLGEVPAILPGVR